MTIHIHVQKEAVPIFCHMAKEAGIKVSDLAEIGVYNLIALYQKDRGIGQQPVDADDGLVPDRKLGLP